MIISDINKIKKIINSSKLLVFDFDGVLADSVDIKTKAFAEIYQPYGDDVVCKVISHHVSNGMSRYRKFKHYHNDYLGQEINDLDILKLADRFSSLVVKKVVDSVEIPGVSLFLKNYCKGQKACAINSSTPQFEMQEIILKRGMQDLFLAVLGSPSSKLDNLTKLKEHYGFNYNEILFFGDSNSDINAAKAANIQFVGVGTEILSWIENETNNYYHINDFLELSK